MGEELSWNQHRKNKEWEDAVKYLASMGLPKHKLGLTREEVESGKVGKYADEEYGMYARHDKPDEILSSDAQMISGHNPTLGKDSPANA